MEPSLDAHGGCVSKKFFSLIKINVVAYGDSKTNANTYQPLLYYNLIYADKPHATITNLAANGRTAATGAAAINAELASVSTDQQYVLFNVGASDLDDSPVEATWKTNIGYIVDAMHTKCPAARIYIMRPWRRDYGTEANAMASWIADIIAARDYCYAGPDERVFLENGDDGVTYTSDGIHPNAAGYALTATQWQSVMGY